MFEGRAKDDTSRVPLAPPTN